ncbi:hypothetical protein D3C84_972200 [compost metagenome]
MLAQRFQLLEIEQFEPQHRISRFLVDPQQLIDFEVQDVGVTVLRVLDQKHHEERDDGRRGVDDQLPGVVVIENRPTQTPQTNQDQRAHEGLGATGPQSEFLRDFCEFHCRVPYRDAPDFVTAPAC